jgi:peptidoglycan/xylan/chitin deacetylase (PgdA/CDA1 family)
MPIQDVLKNWAATIKLPLIYLGFAKDFWREFSDRYLEIEKGARSTFFIIPFKDRPGKTSAGPAPAFRAASYEAREVADAIHKLVDAGCEVGLHGIDAWLDSSEGKKELEEIRRLTGTRETGVRMHWLYFNKKSPEVLEEAGAAYDSTVGYNETIGYRAGTTQAYKPLGANRILELPMHIMDTALFYPDHLGLSAEGARVLFDRMAENAVRFGGCLTINWHDRSVAPERLWGTCYRDFVQDLKARGAWLTTACEAVSWFRKRRSVEFEEDPAYPASMRVRISPNYGDLPGLRMRIYREQNLGEIESCRSGAYVDIAIPKGTQSQISVNVGR